MHENSLTHTGTHSIRYIQFGLDISERSLRRGAWHRVVRGRFCVVTSSAVRRRCTAMHTHLLRSLARSPDIPTITHLVAVRIPCVRGGGRRSLKRID